MSELKAAIRKCGLEHALLELVKLRAPQINGSARCIDMHTKDLRAGGENEQQLYLLNGWREAPLYNDCERAAWAWTEFLTLITDSHAPDETYAKAHARFGEQELANLTSAVIAINGANRLNTAFCAIPRIYVQWRATRPSNP